MKLKENFLIFLYYIMLTYTPQARSMQPATKQEYAWFSVGVGIGAVAATVGTYFLHKRTKKKLKQEMVKFESEQAGEKDTIKLQLQQSVQEKNALLGQNAQLKSELSTLRPTVEPPPTPTRVSALAHAQELDTQERKKREELEREKALQLKHHNPSAAPTS